MNCHDHISKLIMASLLVSLLGMVGCQPQMPIYLTSKGQVNKQYISKATQIDYPDVQNSSYPEVTNSVDPFTLVNPNPTDMWDLSLEEAIQMALKNSKVIRTLNGIGFSKSGVSGVPSVLLSSPSAVSTVYDPALIEADPRFGVEAALSAVDAQLSASANWAKTDNPSFRDSNTYQDDTGNFSMQIQKPTMEGGVWYLEHASTYNQRNSYFGNMMTPAPSSWGTYIEGGFRQALLQGFGPQFNRIAGVDAVTPGSYNGVAIARINTDQALNDFEMATRNLVVDVETAYWNLYYAYHRLESVRSGRDSAHQTWSQVYAKYQAGAKDGAARFEAQARNNYFAFRSQVEAAQSNLFKTERALRYALGLAPTDGRLIRPLDEPIIAPLNFDVSSIVTEGLHRSPELRRQKWEVKKSELELIAAKNFLLPRLDFTAGYRFSGAGKDLVNSRHHNNAFDSMTGGNYASWVMGLEASVPLGFRKELAGVRHAQMTLAKDRALLREQELALAYQLQESISDIALAYQQTQTMLQSRVAAEDEVVSVAAAVQIGSTTLDQLLSAQQRQSEAETNYYSSIIDYNLALMTLHSRKGSLLEYNNIYLAEGPWPGKAYFDAKRQARMRDAAHNLNYGFTRPRVVSRGRYQQHQNFENMVFTDTAEPDLVPLNNTSGVTSGADSTILETPSLLESPVQNNSVGETPVMENSVQESSVTSNLTPNGTWGATPAMVVPAVNRKRYVGSSQVSFVEESEASGVTERVTTVRRPIRNHYLQSSADSLD